MFRTWFKIYFFILDLPWFPWSLGEFDEDTVLENVHTKPLALRLERFCPELYARWGSHVLPAARNAKKQAEKLERLKDKEEGLSAQKAKWEAQFDPRLDSLGQQPHEPWYAKLLTIGLSLMLFLGISEFMGIDIQSLTPENYPLAILALVGAASINIAEKWAIELLVKNVRQYEPRRNYEDTKHIKNIIPFWKRYQTGDPVSWLALLMVALETCFAAPGLIGLLPPKLLTNFVFQASVFFAAGLAALVNVSLAWGIALAQIMFKQEQERIIQKREQWMAKKKKDPNVPDIIEVQNERIKSKLESAKARLSQVKKQKKEQEKIYKDAKIRASLEYERWEVSVRRWERKNAQKIEEFYLAQSPSPQLQSEPQYLQRNGHNPSLESQDYTQLRG